jgi:UDP-glucose 4-epimerase
MLRERAIVTGGAGFIGSAIVDRLVRADTEVLVIDDLSRGCTTNLEQAFAEGARLENLDIRDGVTLTKEFTSFRPDHVFHLAGQIDVRASMDDPALDASINVLGAVNVFVAAMAAGVRRIVNTSTGGAIYGETSVVPTSEATRPNPTSAYGLSKSAAELYARWFTRTGGLDVITLRYGNVYGPRQNPVGDAGVVAVFCDRLLAGLPITVYGDGKQTRDYIYVADIATANLAATRIRRPRCREFNIGTGVEISVLELIDAIEAVADARIPKAQVQFAAPRPGELRRSCLDVSRARRELGLRRTTPLEAGLARTVEWVESRRERWPHNESGIVGDVMRLPVPGIS